MDTQRIERKEWMKLEIAFGDIRITRKIEDCIIAKVFIEVNSANLLEP